jgi:hypothetical protein
LFLSPLTLRVHIQMKESIAMAGSPYHFRMNHCPYPCCGCRGVKLERWKFKSIPLPLLPRPLYLVSCGRPRCQYYAGNVAGHLFSLAGNPRRNLLLFASCSFLWSSRDVQVVVMVVEFSPTLSSS